MPQPTARVRPKIGLIMPHWEGLGQARTPAPRWADMRATALDAEDAGFDSVWLTDHLIFAGDPPAGVWDGWSTLAALAVVTRRVELGHQVLCTGFRNPALLAKMADTIDEISNGRFILGIGAGWNEYEYRAFGYPFDHRVSRFEEAIQIIHGLLRNGEIDFEGTYYSARECELRPRGPRTSGAPVMVGSESPRMLRLMAQYADMWNTWLVYGRNHPDQVPPLRDAVDAACADVGRDPASLERTLGVLVWFSGVANPHIESAEPIRGSIEEIAARFWAFADEGISHLSLRLAPETLEPIEQIGRVIELMDRGR
jgi:alkanesulfonate monooxygenase SsuD/methylene tetrahydromethanopterin reductase-like flavin-dependent oxidoreductase (luciferase family)